jgi:NAD(P)-dependent dehydrogenase (short-subunit alcohol dehydrogenase family)
MSKPVAIITGANQGIGQATAMRPARDYSALVVVARNRCQSSQSWRMNDGDLGQRPAITCCGRRIAPIDTTDTDVASGGQR